MRCWQCTLAARQKRAFFGGSMTLKDIITVRLAIQPQPKKIGRSWAESPFVSVRTTNLIRTQDCWEVDVGLMALLTDEDILAVRGLGHETLKEIREVQNGRW